MIQLINTDHHRLTITTLYVGPDLSKYVKSDKQLFSICSIAEACLFGKQIANGLAYVHSKEIVHFGLKPQNILLSASYRIFLLNISHSKRAPFLQISGL